MTCFIDVGGGNRGVYGAGVAERLLDDGITFDYCIGVSAGSANIVTYLAKQNGRLYRFYHDYAFRPEYMSLKNLIKKGEYIGLDYIYDTITDEGGEDPLDLKEIMKYKGLLELTATDAETGKPVYFGKEDMDPHDYRVLRASCSIPFVCKPVVCGGRAYFDGGISNPVPIERALEKGCDKIVLVLTRPVDSIKKVGADGKAAKLIKSRYPEISSQLMTRAEKYNEAVAKAIELSREGKCLILAPDDCCGVGTLRKTPENIDALYRKAYDDAAAVKSFLS